MFNGVFRSAAMSAQFFRRRPPWHAAARTSEQAPDVFFVEGPASNWIILREQHRFTLVDGGYLADVPHVLESLRFVGLRPDNAAAMLITHGHTDHTGSARHFATEYGTPVLSSAAEHLHLLGREKFQVTVGQVLPHAWRPRTVAWAVHAIRAGGLRDNDIAQAAVWETERLPDLPGGPVAVPAPGHTPGHSAFHLPGAGVVITGDALVTGHPISPRSGPQLLHPMFHHRIDEARSSLERLAFAAETVILPGHGPALAGNLAAAAAAAK
jgi:glyoxylase-like metal-dependent hydrolase (beta-lactamase superfamily II)